MYSFCVHILYQHDAPFLRALCGQATILWPVTSSSTWILAITHLVHCHLGRVQYPNSWGGGPPLNGSTTRKR
jgi:hypothetical protein